ncbi:MAG: hypothetical protein J7L44_03355 [Candidatus Diapherotrites archaeon]|nr:hypothetical protein [Candidatus Diapherotrites archaeon]
MVKAFIATLGRGKGTWGHVARLIQEAQWDQILLIGTEFTKQNFRPARDCAWLLINPRSGFETLKEAIKKAIPEAELYISLISGSGREHTALLSALRELGKDYKLVVLTGDGTKYY